MSIYGETWGNPQDQGPRRPGHLERSSTISSYFGERPLASVPEDDVRPPPDMYHEKRMAVLRGAEQQTRPSRESPLPRAARQLRRPPFDSSRGGTDLPPPRSLKQHVHPSHGPSEQGASVSPIEGDVQHNGSSMRWSFVGHPLDAGHQKRSSGVVGTPRDPTRHHRRASWRSSFIAPTPEPGQRPMSIGEAYGIPHRQPGQRSSYRFSDREKVWSVFEVLGVEDGAVPKVKDFEPGADKTDSDEMPMVEAQKPSDAPKRPLWLDILLILILCFAQITAQMSLAQSINPLQLISASLGTTDPGEQSWFAAAYSLTTGTFILPAGRLGDMFGHKLLFLIGLAWYGCASIICGTAVYSGVIHFSIARALQGIGSSLMVPNGLALLGREFNGMKRNLAFAFFGACAPIGYLLGSVFSAIFAQLTWWPWVFYAAAIYSVVLFSIAMIVIPRAEEKTEAERNLTFDWAGCVLGISGLILLNFSWNQSGVVGWETPYCYALLIVSAVLLAAFIWVELNYAVKPLVPVRSLSRTASLVLLCIVAGWASFGVWVWYAQDFLMLFRGTGPLLMAAEFAPIGVSGLIAAMTTGVIIQKLRPGALMMIAMVFFAVGNILMATVPVEQTYWAQFFVMLLVMPFGMDMSFPAGTLILSESMAREDQGTAASLVTTTVNYSISLSLGIAGTIVRYLTGSSSEPATVLFGFRAALYFAIGLDGLGLLIATYLTFFE